MPLASIPYHPAASAEEATSSDIGLGRPMLFQVTQVNSLTPLWPYVLALHVNPGSLQEQYTKSKNVVMTRGGFVEFIWPDDLDSLSADATTGAFIGPDSGLTSDSANSTYQIGRGAGRIRNFKGRHGTIAWERHMDLLELFRQNGQIFNGVGVPVLRSQILCMYDRGVYSGWFTTFEISETGDTPFQFKLTWEFKVVRTEFRIPGTQTIPGEEDVQPVKPDPGNTQAKRDAEAAAAQWEVIKKEQNLNAQNQPVDPEVQAALKPNPPPLSETEQVRANNVKYGF